MSGFSFNFLGIAFVSDNVPQEQSKRVYETMDKIIEKYSDLAQDEFEQFLDKEGLESSMGVVMKKLIY
jgi:hypothetical protein